MIKAISTILIVNLILSGFVISGLQISSSSNVLQFNNTKKFDMVIIAPQIFSDAIQILINHKSSVNIKSFLKTTEKIYPEYKGRDQAEKIKYFIKDSIETNNISYVLLMGGRKGQSYDWFVPVRYAFLDDKFIHTHFISDLYYADIYKNNKTEFENWDPNGNGLFAEWTEIIKEDLDLKPDVFLGRLPCRNVQQCKDVINKIINYENSNYEKKDWFNRILLIGGDTNPGVGEPFSYEGEVSSLWIAQYLEGHDIIKLFTSDGTLSESWDTFREINSGCGFIYFGGHGWPYKWATYKPNQKNEQVTALHSLQVPLLKNYNKFPIIVFGGCVSTKFDVTILNILNLHSCHIVDCVPECISWTLLKQKDSGAIGYIGGSSTTYGDVGDNETDGLPDLIQHGGISWINSEFFRLYFEEGFCFLGEIHAKTIENYINNYAVMEDKIHCKTIEELLLIGDPSLRIGGYT
jgi:hypothetical protein